VIVIGAPIDSYPYSFLDDRQQLTGFATDLSRAVAAEMRATIRFEAHPSPDLTDLLKDGSVDVLQLFSRSADREAFADFSVPFLRLQGALFIATRNSDRYSSFRDIQGGRLAVVGVGSTALAFVRDHRLDVTVEYAPTPETALRWVAQGRCDATFLTRLTALSTIRRKDIRGLEMLGEPLADYDIRHCFAVRDGEAQLLARLNEALALVHSSGAYDRIYHRWFVGIDVPIFTRQQVVQWAAAALAVFSLLACWALIRQRRLHRRLRRQSAEIAGQAEMLRALYENIPLGVLVFRRAAGVVNLLAMNEHAARLLGTPGARGMDLPIDKLPWPEEWLALAQEWIRGWPRASAPIHEERLVGTTRRRMIDVARVATEATDSGEARLFVLLDDVTEHKRMGEEVAQGRRLRALGELVGGIAHEFNNLMSPLLLEAGTLKLARPGDRELQTSMEVMIDATRRAAELTRRLLTFARRNESPVELIDIGAIAHNCAALVRPTLDRRITWDLQIPPDLPRLPGISTDVQQVLLNLLINARDALVERLGARTTGPGAWTPELRLGARHHPVARTPAGPVGPESTTGWIELAVADNGPGMDPITVERIFEPFFTTKEVGRGTGLGLSTAWSMVNKAGGEIRVESTPGAGSAFHVWLPIVATRIRAQVTPTPSHPPPSSARTGHILVVDDEPALARALCSMLHRRGHTTETCGSGSEAIARIEADGVPWDAVVLDVNLPGATGVEVARVLRQRGYGGRIVLMSGRATEMEAHGPDAPHIDARLDKPFQPADLMAALEAVRKPET